MIKYGQSWNEYRANPSLNGSTLALIRKSPAYLRHYVDNDLSPLESTTRVGTGLHSLVEALPDVDPSKLWVEMPNYKLDRNNRTATGKQSTSKTDWVRQQEKQFAQDAASKGLDVLKYDEVQRITRMLGSIAANPEAMDLIKDSQREVSVTAEIAGIQCKGRVDGLSASGVQWNLKCCGRGVSRRDFGYAESDFGYTFKDAMHYLLLETCGNRPTEFKYILVDDCKPYGHDHQHAGKFARPAECTVVDVPIDVLKSMTDEVIEKVELYRKCHDTDSWPGVQPYTYVPSAPEVTLVD